MAEKFLAIRIQKNLSGDHAFYDWWAMALCFRLPHIIKNPLHLVS